MQTIYVWVCIATAAALNKQVQNEPMKICVTQGEAKSELLSEVIMYLVRVGEGISAVSRASLIFQKRFPDAVNT